jgi:putative restriction endonuclease
VSVGDKAYIVSLSEGQLYLGGRMEVKRIVSRSKAIQLCGNDNLYDATEWIVDPEKTGTLLNLQRRLSPALTKQLRFLLSSGPSQPKFKSDAVLDNQATRGVREITPESAALLDRIIEVTDRLPPRGELLTVTEELLAKPASPSITVSRRTSEDVPSANAYVEAFRIIHAEGIAENHLALLRGHFNAPNHTTTWAQLAQFVGYANGAGVNLQYGHFAARVAKALGFAEPPMGFWLNVLADWADELDVASGHTAFVLRSKVIEALQRLGILPRTSMELQSGELEAGSAVTEGSCYQVLVNAYERSAEARRRCIEVHGTICWICKFNFGAFYGPTAQGYIHVHHRRALSEIGGKHVVDPVADLRPVCPNCHAVIHLGGKCRTIEEVQELIRMQVAVK